MKVCLFCNKPLTGKYQTIFCGNSCSAKTTNKRRIRKYTTRKCQYCGIGFTKPSQTKFCSLRCGAFFNNKIGKETRYIKIRKWKPKPCDACGKPTRNSKYCCRPCLYSEIKPKRFPHLDKKASDRILSKEAYKRYIAAIRGQTPKDVDVRLLQEIYAHCPKGYEVDHIIPISKGGLHHPDNLQYLPRFENRSKKDKLDYVTDNAINPIDLITRYSQEVRRLSHKQSSGCSNLPTATKNTC